MNPVDEFLDAADKVLNSNTLLTRITPFAGDIQEALRTFIVSGKLHQFLLEADISRGWYYLHHFDDAGNTIPVPWYLDNPDFPLMVQRSRLTAEEYLEGLLRGDGRLGNFISYYCCAKPPVQARQLTKDLLNYIFPGIAPALYILKPDFLRNDWLEADDSYYFENKGCDNAAVLVNKTVAYLLLTSGMP